MIGDLVETAKGTWGTEAPTRCPSGHTLMPDRMLVGFQVCGGAHLGRAHVMDVLVRRQRLRAGARLSVPGAARCGARSRLTEPPRIAATGNPMMAASVDDIAVRRGAPLGP